VDARELSKISVLARIGVGRERPGPFRAPWRRLASPRKKAQDRLLGQLRPTGGIIRSHPLKAVLRSEGQPRVERTTAVERGLYSCWRST
jgi:hypothetical protein